MIGKHLEGGFQPCAEALLFLYTGGFRRESEVFVDKRRASCSCRATIIGYQSLLS